MSSNIEHLTIQKAKKKEGFYLCPVGCIEMKTPFVITFNTAKMLYLRETSSTIIIKCKNMSKYMDELNDKIIETVRDNSRAWFNSSIDDELIEEYYISTLQYDKKRGETIRLKVKNIDELDHDLLDVTGSLTVCLKYLKFYKQKFFPEFDIVSFKPNEHVGDIHNIPMFSSESEDEDGVDFDNEAEEEIPKPSFEEIYTMKAEMLNQLYSRNEMLKSQMTDIQRQLESFTDAIQNLEKSNEPNNIIKICDAYQNLICE